ncbi:hypothetical protein PoB_002110300 [Plakobranchus ocellatus]|uniref:Uncharacterized protein n=1 Tax=Plakobranchus ocellatus TaxID=259542 RepID=A0AAV3ZJE1_9GAST|nr:hypothetical protein PoB_002110300 [Plakobranchus ocellatus]
MSVLQSSFETIITGTFLTAISVKLEANRWLVDNAAAVCNSYTDKVSELWNHQEAYAFPHVSASVQPRRWLQFSKASIDPAISDKIKTLKDISDPCSLLFPRCTGSLCHSPTTSLFTTCHPLLLSLYHKYGPRQNFYNTCLHNEAQSKSLKKQTCRASFGFPKQGFWLYRENQRNSCLHTNTSLS